MLFSLNLKTVHSTNLASSFFVCVVLLSCFIAMCSLKSMVQVDMTP